ncbi:hypothetical protein FKW77_004957 [Venturia effusa]|uniref:Ribonuclease H1 N-terminal domain-containing protein n=1 Tax=Venturia effusa TaxID=50376 RepID=A0A517LK51_9PEZI|nr:hypothetical protein FKW77_004957 [Venturia effusa]
MGLMPASMNSWQDTFYVVFKGRRLGVYTSRDEASAQVFDFRDAWVSTFISQAHAYAAFANHLAEQEREQQTPENKSDQHHTPGGKVLPRDTEAAANSASMAAQSADSARAALQDLSLGTTSNGRKRQFYDTIDKISDDSAQPASKRFQSDAIETINLEEDDYSFARDVEAAELEEIPAFKEENGAYKEG